MILLPLAVTLLSTEPLTRDDEPSPTPAEERDEDRARYVERTHTELSFGYLGEWRDDTLHSWQLAAAHDGAPPSVGSLVAPFGAAPFSGFRAAGMTVESRTVTDGVRFTLGLRWPFASYRVQDSEATVELDGAPRALLLRSLSVFEVRTGLGYELAFRRATPFVDVLGDVQSLSASLSVDGTSTAWKATSFSLGARLGVRLQVSQVFVVIAAEASVLGSPRYGGGLQAGVAF